MNAVFILIDTVLALYVYALIAFVILSWLTAFDIINRSQPFVYAVQNFLYAITEPVLRPMRRYIPSVGGVDLSVLVLFLLIQFLRNLLRDIFYSM